MDRSAMMTSGRARGCCTDCTPVEKGESQPHGLGLKGRFRQPKPKVWAMMGFLEPAGFRDSFTQTEGLGTTVPTPSIPA